ncbi:MAG TPA: hypothetical protein VJ824_07900 [Bacillota bacterium]|nr:hypothetical protein [Bacillota bacterium]
MDYSDADYLMMKISHDMWKMKMKLNIPFAAGRDTQCVQFFFPRELANTNGVLSTVQYLDFSSDNVGNIEWRFFKSALYELREQNIRFLSIIKSCQEKYPQFFSAQKDYIRLKFSFIDKKEGTVLKAIQYMINQMTWELERKYKMSYIDLRFNCENLDREAIRQLPISVKR